VSRGCRASCRKQRNDKGGFAGCATHAVRGFHARGITKRVRVPTPRAP
jgi:hypothetical protein